MSAQPNPSPLGANEFVSFSAGGQVFCLEITQIREIRRWSPVTALPHTPDDVMGVMNLRGAVIPIFDLAARFGLGATDASERNVVIMAAAEQDIVGLLVESVSEILTIDPSDIQDTPDFGADTVRSFITGIIAQDDTMIRVVDLKSVMGGALASAFQS